MTHSDDATRATAAMRHLVLEQNDRRQQVAEALGMGFVRIKALRRLAAQPLRMSDLATAMGVDKPYTTLVVDDFERRGLVVRSVDPADRRAKIVTITDAGRALAVEADRILSYPAPGLLRLTAEELSTLVRLVEKASEEDDDEGVGEGAGEG